MASQPVIGVLLAAGAGHRLGLGPKALLSFGGKPQAVRMLEALWRGGCAEVVVVLGAGADQVQQMLASGDHHIVVNKAWQTGLGSSFQRGVDAAARLMPPDSAGSVLVALADQPDIDEAVVSRLRERASAGRVTAASFRNRQGQSVRSHPVIFPILMAQRAAERAGGDVGARAWLRDHPDLVDLVDMDHLATGRDVDTPGDLDWWSSAAPASRGAYG